MNRIISAVSFLFLCSWSLYGQGDWTQKAPFAGGARAATVGFSIGHYGFIGCGTTIPVTNPRGDSSDFWRWDSYTNGWTKIANYPGGPMETGLGFSIEGKGYVCFGWNGAGMTSMYRYDTISNAWTQMATFPGPGRYSSADFVIGHKAYIIAGSTGGPPYLSDVWVYDAHQNTWTQLNNFPGGSLEGVLAFSIGNHGYAGDGWNSSTCDTTMYEYDTASDTWTNIAAIPYAYGIGGSVNCTLGSKGYVFNGQDCTTYGIETGWVYDTVTKGWCSFTDIGKSAISRGANAAFVINNHIYMGTGYDTNNNNLGDFLEYTPFSKFTVSDTVNCGIDTAHFSASPGYLSPSYSWSFSGGTPATSNLQNPTVIYANSGTYSVTLIVNACGGSDTVKRTIKVQTVSLRNVTITGKTPTCAGIADTLIASGGGTYLWSNGATTSSILISPNLSTTYTVKVTNGCSKDTSIFVTVKPAPSVSLTGQNIICAGDSTTLYATGGDTYKWSNGSTATSIVADPNITYTYSLTVTGSNGCPKDTSVKVSVTPLPSVSLSGSNTICAGDSTTLSATGGSTYAWSNGATTSFITVDPRNNIVYYLTVRANGCEKDTGILVNVNTLTATIIAPLTICHGDTVTLYSSGGGTYHWSNGSSTSSISVNPFSTTTYSVVITNGACVKDTSVMVTVETCTTAGVDNYQNSSSSVNVYPNPSKGLFTLVIASEAKQSSNTIEVYNVLGEKVYNAMLKQVQHNYEIDLSFQPNGIYLYRIISKTGDLVGEGKVVVQK